MDVNILLYQILFIKNEMDVKENVLFQKYMMQNILELFKYVLYVCYGYIFNFYVIDMFQEYLNVLIE